LQNKFFDWASIGGGMIFLRSLKAMRNEKNFELGQKYFFFSFMNPLYEPIPVFPKFDPLTASGMALCVCSTTGKPSHLFRSAQAWTLYEAPQWNARYPNSCPERIKM
jgi:hypothetical protein